MMHLKYISYLVLFLFMCGCTNSKKESKNHNTVDKRTGFEAKGNEPFWSLEIDFEDRIKFKTIDKNEFSLTFPKANTVQPQDINAITYQSNNNDYQIDIMVVDKKCLDNMSGKESDYSVKINLTKKNGNQTIPYSGCGNYTGKALLNGIWQLSEINNKPVSKFSKPPNIQFRYEKGNVSGFTGCNRFKGNVEFTNQFIKTARISVTNLACENKDIEKEFLNSIKNKTLTYEINGDSLTLITKQKNLFFTRLKFQ
ncbi:META domain-containing protein [Mangrovivirga sp. M17]|uniref:META domain-containing protein n=1 Tax=Mangrovivirga halotolerans TaxID=2993936 RepID=A0ABT3RN86_9BACT|nr:META domain-containing protein [Mangrovivirga halotolerans]MCX2743273.1 META domain-containing protein [Mangrovivirga halotolerans]